MDGTGRQRQALAPTLLRLHGMQGTAGGSYLLLQRGKDLLWTTLL